MFGLLRYAFAAAVVASHAYTRTPPGPAAYAVWGFFVLSGYLMALVLDRKYPMTPAGLRAFASARALRLMPGYYAACVMMIGVLMTWPDAGHAYIGLHLPARASGWLNAALPFLPPMGLGEILAQFPAVRIEVVHYAAMALGLARSTRVAVAWWVAAASYAAWQVASGASFDARYHTIAGTSVAFATGVLVYRLRGHIPAWRSPWAIPAAGLVWVAHLAVALACPVDDVLGVGLYTSVAASAVTVAMLRGVDARRVPGWLARLDRLGGDLSYPIYLTHWAAGVLALVLTGRGRTSGTQLAVTLVVCHAVSWVVLRAVEGGVDRWRAGRGVGRGGQEGRAGRDRSNGRDWGSHWGSPALDGR